MFFKQKVLLIPQRSEPEHSVTSLNTTMFHILILVQMNNTKTCENKGHVLTDTAMAQTFFSLSPTDATNVLAHYGGMFDYFKGTFCLIHFANTHI